MTFLAALALLLTPTLSVQTTATPETTSPATTQTADTDEDDAACIIVLGHRVCF